MDAELLKILCCPETHQELHFALGEQLEKINAQIAAKQLKNRGGNVVQEKIESGLVRADGRFLYPIRENIPIMLVDEAIPIN